MYVVDCDNHHIQVFIAEGQFLRKFGKFGSGNGELNIPSSIIIDSEDVVYVTDKNNRHVSVFTCEGKFLTSFGTQGSGPGQFSSPCGIAVDKNGVVMLATMVTIAFNSFKTMPCTFIIHAQVIKCTFILLNTYSHFCI